MKADIQFIDGRIWSDSEEFDFEHCSKKQAHIVKLNSKEKLILIFANIKLCQKVCLSLVGLGHES